MFQGYNFGTSQCFLVFANWPSTLKRSFVLFFSAAFVLFISQDAIGQIFQRNALDPDSDADAAFIIESEIYGYSEFELDFDEDDLFVGLGGVAYLQDANSLAHAQTAVVASVNTATGTFGFFPTVQSGQVLSLIASGDDAEARTLDNNPYNSTSSRAEFEFQEPLPGDYTLYVTLRLTGLGVRVGAAELGIGSSIYSAIGDYYHVSAEYLGGDMWHTTGVLPGEIVDETSLGINEYFDFEIPITEGETLYLETSTDVAPSYAMSAWGQLNYGLAASAWAVARVNPPLTPFNDLDGDGDVDINDLLAVLGAVGTGGVGGIGGLPSNTGIPPGGSGIYSFGEDESFIAALSDGDTNRDGIVDVEDVQNVLDASGISIPGDFNGDLLVNGDDYTLLAGNWGNTVPPNPSGWIGDLPTLPAIDGDELDRLLFNWGNDYSTGSTLATIPEPTSLALLSIVGIHIGMRRRR